MSSPSSGEKPKARYSVPSLFISLEDALVLGFRGLGRVLRRRLSLGDGGEHGRSHPTLERLVNRGGAISRIARVGRPAQPVAHHVVLMVRRGPRLSGTPLAH